MYKCSLGEPYSAVPLLTVKIASPHHYDGSPFLQILSNGWATQITRNLKMNASPSRRSGFSKNLAQIRVVPKHDWAKMAGACFMVYTWCGKSFYKLRSWDHSESDQKMWSSKILLVLSFNKILWWINKWQCDLAVKRQACDRLVEKCISVI